MLLLCYCPQSSPQGTQHQQQVGRRYRLGGTTLISLPQAISFKAAVDFAVSIGTPLNAHCTFHWVGTDAGDDPTGDLFAEVREAFSLWLRRGNVPFAAVFAREKRSGGQAEVEHGHLLFHLPDAWLKGAKLVSVSGGVEGGAELLQVEAALSRIVRRCAGRLEHYAVKLKIPTDACLPMLAYWWPGRAMPALPKRRLCDLGKVLVRIVATLPAPLHVFLPDPI